jgi:NitT/TauT family transport system permease protein
MTVSVSPALSAGPRVGTRRALAWRASALRWATVAVLVALWEVVCQGPLAGNAYLAPPSQVLTEGLTAVLQPDTIAALQATTLRFLEAFVIVVVLGPAVGLVLGRLHRQIFLGARDVVSVLYALPLVPFYPLFVLWLGLGTRSEVAFGVIHGIIPVILMTMSASATVDATLLQSGQTMGASHPKRLLFIVVPSVLPDIVGALKIGAALTLLGVLLAELMISISGVGTFIGNAITNQQAAALDAMVLVVCVGAVAVNAVLSYVERRTSYWRD